MVRRVKYKGDKAERDKQSRLRYSIRKRQEKLDAGSKDVDKTNLMLDQLDYILSLRR